MSKRTKASPPVSKREAAKNRNKSKIKRAERVIGSDGLRPVLPVTEKSDVALALERYIECAINPFDSLTGTMPKTPGLHSSKHRCWIKGTFECGTSGFGFVSSRASVASDLPTSGVATGACSRSNTGYGSDIINHNSGTAGVNSKNLNSPFVTADFGADKLHHRVISRGIRVRYIGTELNRSGRLVAFAHPTGGSVDGFDFAMAQSFPHAETTPVSRQWSSVVYVPVHEGETDYKDDHLGTHSDVNLAIMVESEAGNKFEYEVFEHFEVIGPTLGTNATESPSDDGIFSRIQTYLQNQTSEYFDRTSKMSAEQLSKEADRIMRMVTQAADLARMYYKRK